MEGVHPPVVLYRFQYKWVAAKWFCIVIKTKDAHFGWCVRAVRHGKSGRCGEREGGEDAAAARECCVLRWTIFGCATCTIITSASMSLRGYAGLTSEQFLWSEVALQSLRYGTQTKHPPSPAARTGHPRSSRGVEFCDRGVVRPYARLKKKEGRATRPAKQPTIGNQTK